MQEKLRFDFGGWEVVLKIRIRKPASSFFFFFFRRRALGLFGVS